MEFVSTVKAPRFGKVRGESPQYAIASMDLAGRALNFVISGFGAGLTIETDAFKNSLQATLAECIFGSGLGIDSAHYKNLEKGRSYEDFCLLAWASLVATQLGWAEQLALGKTVPILPMMLEDELAAGVVTNAGGQVLEGILANQPNLATAWGMAKLNIKRAEARISLAFTLKDAAKVNGNKISCKTAESQIDGLIDRLFEQLEQTRMQMFAVGTLLGEVAQSDLKAMAKTIYGEGKSVMHLLQLDGKHPGSYRSDDETALRSDIQKALR